MPQFEVILKGDALTINQLERLIQAVKLIDRNALAYVHEGTDISDPCIAFVSTLEEEQ